MTNLQTTRILIRFIYSMAVLLRDGHCTSKSDFKRELDAAENELDAAENGESGESPDSVRIDAGGLGVWRWTVPGESK